MPWRPHDETYKRHAVELTLRGDRMVTAVALCEVLGIAPSSYYRWRRPQPSAQERHQSRLLGAVFPRQALSSGVPEAGSPEYRYRPGPDRTHRNPILLLPLEGSPRPRLATV